GILFVVDSSPDQLEENVASFNELHSYLDEGLGRTIPLVITLNKRDIGDALPRSTLVEKLNLQNFPIYETVATTGLGIKRAFQSLAREVLMIQLYGTKKSQIA
ncbi:MAG: ADP-ribosylation factor-like protein, partial [Candidatus Hodarchaeales archaeon]